MKDKILQVFIMMLLILSGVFLPDCSAHAEMVLDGTMGTAGALKGPAYNIPSEYGQKAGKNLFHSFQTFNINAKESATFSGPSSIQNVISRVTGGSLSRIDGQLKCTIPNANFYLLNPVGVIFGADASLDVGGSFHVSTADYLRLGDHERFYATPLAGEVLSSAAPTAFGFLNDTPAPIRLEGKGKVDQSVNTGLSVSEGKTISLIGGDIDIKGTSYYSKLKDNDIPAGSLSAPGGQINLISAASRGEAVMTESAPDVSSFQKMGTVKMSDLAQIEVSTYAGIGKMSTAEVNALDGTGKGAGSVYIRAEQFVADKSIIEASTIGDKNGGTVSVEADAIALKNQSHIYSDTFRQGKAGDIVLSGRNNGSARSVELSGSSNVYSNTENQKATGDAGDILIKADNVSLSAQYVCKTCVNFSEISSYSKTIGQGGNITIEAPESVKISGSRIWASSESKTAGAGDAGSINIETKNFSMTDKARLSVDTDAAKGGAISIRGMSNNPAESVQISDSAIFAGANGEGDAGRLFIESKNIAFTDGGVIGSQSFYTGKGGDVLLHATESLKFSGQDTKGNPSKVYTSSEAKKDPAGDAGNITIEADQLSFAQGTGITASTIGPGNAGAIKLTVNHLKMDNGSITSSTDSKEKGGHAGTIDILATQGIEMNNKSLISTATAGGGAAGDISLKVENLNVDNGSSVSSASSSPPDYPGDAGRISIQANDSLLLGVGTSITTEAINGGRGQIVINTGNTFSMESSKITTTIKRGGNDAGDITINMPEWIVMRDSKIVANAYKGRGGNIHLTSDHFVQSTNSKVDASSELGIDGTVIIDSPDTDVSSGLVVLPANFMDATRWIKTPCALRSGEKVSRLVISGQDAVATAFNDWHPSPSIWLTDSALTVGSVRPSAFWETIRLTDTDCLRCKECQE
jgi:filamentous hemagglutinin family protein